MVEEIALGFQNSMVEVKMEEQQTSLGETALGFQNSMVEVKMEEQQTSISETALGFQNSMVEVKMEEQQTSMSDYLDVMNQISIRKDGLSARIHQHTLGKIKTEVGEEPSAMDHEESNNPMESIKGVDPSVRYTCGSNDWLKIEVEENPFAKDFSDTIHIIKEEDGEEPSMVAHRDFLSQVKLEEGEETKSQHLMALSLHEVKEEPFACNIQELTERRNLERTAVENWDITKTENPHKSTRACATQMGDRGLTGDGTAKPTELELESLQTHMGQISCLCTLCGESFRDTFNFSSHQCCHMKSYPCTFCEMCFTQPTDLITHMRIHIQEKVYKRSALEMSPSNKLAVSMRKTTRTGLRSDPCIDCKQSCTQSSVQCAHPRIQCGKIPHECTECTKIFFTFYSLRKHQMSHSGEKPHGRKECSRAIRDASALKIHDRIHTGEKPYKCTECQKSFHCLTKLKCHQKYYTGKKLYEWQECKTSFRLSSSFKRHQKIHSEVKSYECKVCKKPFRESSVLKRHERIHTEEKPYQCTECQKCFHRSDHLKQHQLTHSEVKPYECTECCKHFKFPSSFKRHRLTVCGVKPENVENV